MKQLAYTVDALRTLGRMPVNVSKRIQGKLSQYLRNPGALANNVKPLAGTEGMLRLQIGDWRVLFTDSGQVVRIIKIAPRGSDYRGL